MSIRNLDKIFKPQRVAVIGASNQRGSVGHTVLHNLINTNFPGVVYPVNPKYEAVHGIQTYPDVKGLPHPPDLALICTPARTVPGIIRECGEAGVLGVIIISAGFRETGKDGKALEQQVTEELARFKGMRMIGPNCLGIIAPGQHLNASFAAATPKLGHVAFVSQSGALCTSVLDWALEADIGFSFFVSVGNMLDVDIADLIDYFGRDPHTHSIILYVESITGARKFLSAARAFCRTKPIIAYKAGRFTESAQAAASHTGALAGEDAVYDAAFERAGIVRVFEIDDIFDAAELLAHQQLPDGPRLAIVTNAGGPGVMATDYLISRGGILARLSETTLQRLDEGLPSFWSHGNPVDVLGDAPAERFAQASQVVLEDSSVDALLVILTPQAMTDPKRTAQVVGALEAGTRKPILASWMGGDRVHAGIQVLNRSGIPTYTTPEQAVSAFMHLVRYARNLETIQETPRNIPVEFRLDRHRLRQFFNTILSERHEVLSETLSKALLDAYEIPVTTPYTARTADEAVEQARWLGYPVVLKVLSAQITHKSDVGGVAINLFSEKEVRGAFEAIVTRAQQKRPEAQVEGVTVQRMVDTKDSVELILGTKKDPTMGAVIMVGTGGTAAEVFRDRTLALPPLNERLARRMLESLRAWPLLQGYRGKPAVNLDRLLETLMRLSYLVADYPEVAELDINPLLVTPTDVVALDARVVIDRGLLNRPVRPYAHLAIRPYPEEYVRSVKARDGTPVVLRPIRPEDEPTWHEMLGRASEESIRLRFRSMLKAITHEMAARYCLIDYDREMAIVAELEEKGERKLVGVGRLIADPDHREAEYSVFVTDPWQGKGLGGLLTDYVLEIARDWGVGRIFSDAAIDNPRMIELFRSRGFQVQTMMDEGVVMASRVLGE